MKPINKVPKLIRIATAVIVAGGLAVMVLSAQDDLDTVRQTAAQGDATAQVNLGLMYREGQDRTQRPSVQASGESPETDGGQIEAQLAEKAQRTPAQRKISSQLLDAQRTADARRQAKGEGVEDELVTVDIRADVTPMVLARIRELGGTVINSVPRYRAVRARLPLSAVEKLATLDAVQSIRAADEAVTHGQPTGIPSGAPAGTPQTSGTCTINTSEGDGAR